MENTELDDFEPARSFFSKRAIYTATYLGGPLAAGIMMRHNFTEEGKSEYASRALLLSIVAILLIIATIYFMPEEIMDKVPRILIPAIYTGITYLLVERFQGDMLTEHKNNGGELQPVWKSILICLFSAVVLLFFVVGLFLSIT